MTKPKAQSAPFHLKVPPHNVEAEQAVLGAVLINNDAVNEIMDLLSPEDFYREANGAMFEGILDLYNRSEPIDIITLSQILSRKNLIERIGGTDYLASLVDAVSTSAGIAYHAKIIKDLSVRRKLISQCSTISELCFQEWENAEDLLERAEQSIFDIAEDNVREGFNSLAKVIDSSFKKLESSAAVDGYITGVPTGFTEFDRLTAGLQPSDLIIIAGRPSMGKTALALNIGYNAARALNKGVAVFSLEMSKQQLGIRLLGFDSAIDATKLRTGLLRDKEWARLTESASRLSELPIFIDDSSAITVLEMKAKCRRLKKQGNLAMVIIDYMQLIQGRSSAESRQLEMSEISRVLKGLAKDLDLPVIALSQLNRKVEERSTNRPLLSDLRESGAIEQDADVIAFIYRGESVPAEGEAGEFGNVINIDIAKQRNGPTGTFKLTFQKEYTRFRNYTEAEDPL
ncbi:MAG: replicative DNA helicase [Thermodesulfobacteriota bacterium]|nr:replicative DNA helicase [Thermodesulfobacteriota bacterium]